MGNDSADEVRSGSGSGDDSDRYLLPRIPSMSVVAHKRLR